VLDRAGSGLERLVLIGRDGEVLAHSAPYGYDGHPIRRAQALAVTNGLDLAIARELIAAKLDAQRRILVRLRADLRESEKLRAALDAADPIERVRVIEATGAAQYFAAWRGVWIRFRERDLAHGCDPQMGCLHADQRNRDSLALDAMEPVRADVDAFLLDLLEDRELTARDFGELPNGICRIAAPLTHELALTLPHWRECLRPIVARLAQIFRESLANKAALPRTLAARTGNKRRGVPGLERSPLLATPRKTSQPRPYATRKWRAPTVEARPANPAACALCGEPVLKRRRRHCDACMPKARREHGLRAIEAARKALATQAAAGNDPRRSAAVNRARGEAISEGHRRNRSWAREHPGPRDESWFKREVAPKLDALPLREIAAATGLSLAASSRIRSGARIPHPRYWEALRELVGA
jgi:CRISPR associated protein Cas1